MTKLTHPRALRALAHPIRLALVGMLRREGPLTATRAAALLGESSASASFHLRQLAKYGLVEEAGGGRGRERPWRATAMFTQWPDVAEGAEQQAATALLSSVIAERYFEDLMRWLSAKPEEAPRMAGGRALRGHLRLRHRGGTPRAGQAGGGAAGAVPAAAAQARAPATGCPPDQLSAPGFSQGDYAR